MKNALKFYIDGEWISPSSSQTIPVIDPHTEQPFAEIAAGTSADVDMAVAAARKAFPAFSATPLEQRIALLERILELYAVRADEIAAVLSQEMGAPIAFARGPQVQSAVMHLKQLIALLRDYPFSYAQGTTMIVREPIGVAGLITPWNFPLNQLILKAAPAIATGCTMVVKPSEMSPFSTMLFTEVLHDAGVPAGVFNLVNGDGPTVGHALASHPDVDMISITGSARAGAAVAKAAAESFKRVTQELGGKSVNILLDGVDMEVAVTRGVQNCFRNSGQSCSAPTRLLVPRDSLAAVEEIAERTASSIVVGAPVAEDTVMGPVVSKIQYDRVQHYIEIGMEEGAKLVSGGPGRPDGLAAGYYARPTIFSNVSADMKIAQEEIFGPVLVIMPYETVDEAVAIANDTSFGLSGNVQGEQSAAVAVAGRLRTGQVLINYPAYDAAAPFGGYGQSGNGREQGIWGIEEFLETKAIIGAL